MNDRHDIVDEAETLLKVAKALEPFDDEARCRIMSNVCLQLGRYRDAAHFAALAERHQRDRH